MKDSKRVAIIGIVFVVLIVLLIGMVKIFKDSTKGKTADSMLKHINVIEQQPTKASISLDDNTLFDELPDISPDKIEDFRKQAEEEAGIEVTV